MVVVEERLPLSHNDNIADAMIEIFLNRRDLLHYLSS